MSSTIQTPPVALLRTPGNAESSPTSRSWNNYTSPAQRTFIYRIMTGLWFETRTIWSGFREFSLKNILLWSLPLCLLVISCVLEQETNHTWVRLALSLACAWLVPISMHIRILMRTFRDRGRDDSFIVTAAMLSFILIKAFAILDGYSMVALIRIPICLTLAVWIASHWCNFDATPDVRFGA